MKSVLYVVATPIGNLRDITLRALDALREVDTVICEDTLAAKRLLRAHGIRPPRLLKHTEHQAKDVKNMLEGLWGHKIALIVTAGTPAISDPGAEAVRAARELGFEIVSVPGPSALAAAFSISGIRRTRFTFLGFLPKKRGEILRIMKELENQREVGVAYESTYRILKTLKILADEFPFARVFCAKELTKLHEDARWGTPKELVEWLSGPVRAKGEFVMIFDFSSYCK